MVMEPVVENPVAALSGTIDSTAGMERSSPSVSSLPLAQENKRKSERRKSRKMQRMISHRQKMLHKVRRMRSNMMKKTMTSNTMFISKLQKFVRHFKNRI